LQVNAQQGSELAALRVNFTAEAALRVARLLALETKVCKLKAAYTHTLGA
jgi:hypothetical protein